MCDLQRAPASAMRPECSRCPKDTLRCAHIDMEDCGSPDGMWVRLRDLSKEGEAPYYLIEIDCCEAEGLRATPRLADAVKTFEAHEMAMRKTWEAIA